MLYNYHLAPETRSVQHTVHKLQVREKESGNSTTHRNIRRTCRFRPLPLPHRRFSFALIRLGACCCLLPTLEPRLT